MQQIDFCRNTLVSTLQLQLLKSEQRTWMLLRLLVNNAFHWRRRILSFEKTVVSNLLEYLHWSEKFYLQIPFELDSPDDKSPNCD